MITITTHVDEPIMDDHLRSIFLTICECDLEDTITTGDLEDALMYVYKETDLDIMQDRSRVRHYTEFLFSPPGRDALIASCIPDIHTGDQDSIRVLRYVKDYYDGMYQQWVKRYVKKNSILDDYYKELFTEQLADVKTYVKKIS